MDKSIYIDACVKKKLTNSSCLVPFGQTSILYFNQYSQSKYLITTDTSVDLKNAAAEGNRDKKVTESS